MQPFATALAWMPNPSNLVAAVRTGASNTTRALASHAALPTKKRSGNCPRVNDHRRLAKIVSAAVLSLCMDGLGVKAFADAPIMTTSKTLSSIGVNTHMDTPGNEYWAITEGGRDPEKVLEMLRYIGVSLVRDGIPGGNGQLNSEMLLREFGRLAENGVRFDFQLVDPHGLDAKITNAALFSGLHPGALEAIEGLNEVGTEGVSFNGARGAEGAHAVQNTLYDAVRSHPELQQTQVYNFSVYYSVTEPSAFFGPHSESADVLNIHSYSDEGTPPARALASIIATNRGMLPAKAIAVTENGISTGPNPASPASVSEEVQSKYILNFICDNLHFGVQASYIYQLLDGQDSPRKYVSENHFGLFHYDTTPKRAAVALHAWSRILGRSEHDTIDYRQSQLPQYELLGLPSAAQSMILRKGRNTFDLIIWLEPQLWDRRTMRPMAPVSERVEISLEIPARSIYVFDPLDGPEPLNVVTLSKHATVVISDHPVILEIHE